MVSHPTRSDMSYPTGRFLVPPSCAPRDGPAI